MNIVIVGGGTAGWIAAYMIANSFPQKHKITIVESSKIGIIGAGEGSTGQMLKLLQGGFFPKKDKNFYKSVDINDFMQKTDSVNKMGIKYENWSDSGSSYFSPISLSVTDHLEDDYIFKYVVSKFGGSKVHLSSKNGIEFESKKYNELMSFHFDAHKVGAYFKYLCGNNVTSIDAIVNDAMVDSNQNIKSIKLDTGQIIEADFFIDCSGFYRILMKKLHVEWISCQKYLPVNTAMPFLIQHKVNEEIIPETKATALSAGWMWNIPLKTRRGCGYVFDDNFISNDQAQKEVEKYLGQEIDPIKFIKFDSGYSSYFWKNNVLCLGLSSSFFEPLQATSIHNTILQINDFINNYLFDEIGITINQDNINKYNEYIKLIMTGSLNLISLNYQGGRKDTDFWKSIILEEKVTEETKEVVKKYKTRFPKSSDINTRGHGFGLIQYNAAGLGLVSSQLAYQELVKNNMYDFAKKEYAKYYKAFSYKKT
jgi:tryptophan halogenase